MNAKTKPFSPADLAWLLGMGIAEGEQTSTETWRHSYGQLAEEVQTRWKHKAELVEDISTLEADARCCDEELRRRADIINEQERKIDQREVVIFWCAVLVAFMGAVTLWR
jgi:septal ring factor EnvC (AmiA/AmiB activator)